MFKTIVLPVALLGAFAGAHADEGQWQPHQLPQLKAELKRVGIDIPAEKLADLSKHPMSAIVSLGGCSAAFVSDAGLVVTNHHCAYGAVQRNSTPEHNYITDGFLAKTRASELPGGPNSLVYVTDKVENVSERVLKGLTANMSGRARHEAVEKRIKDLIAECETDKMYRCSVPAFHRGLEYYRIRQMMIRDVRLVYAPSDKIGNFGGDTDNYEWPRHTGDYSFLRAYVGKDGRPADPSPDNVPYKSKDFLVVSAEGLKAGDGILLAGYPGRTSRYKLPAEIRFARDTAFPLKVSELQADLAVMAAATQGDAAAAVRYASVVKSINNVLKKTQGLLDGFARKDIAAIKDGQDAEFRAWYAKQPNVSATLLAELDAAIASDMALSEEEFAWTVATNSDLLKSARTVYRLSQERQKPDAERESGFQQRDLAFIKARLARLEQSYVNKVDQARFEAGLKRYAQLAAKSHPQGLDALLPAPAAVAALYQQTQLADTAKRLAWLDKDQAAVAQSDDAFMQLAVKLYPVELALEERRKEIDGNLERVIPQYMQAVIAWKKSQGKPVYPDANSTLRVTYGTVSPYSPRDGITKGPFTTVEGIVEKVTGKAPFEAPQGLIDAVKQKRYGQFRDPVLGTVPVNFLTSADTTGGNSGSAVMNKRGELIGLNFDSTYESITKDWYFDTAITRAIHLDIRYMLWVMKEVDHADNLLQEMTIKYPKAAKAAK
ncbi:peptidase S46 [Janthinobacterium sp. HH103]|uniref:Dipeptidyl-peptidase n=1 Tax=Janthinobacterium agaricidamnosum TaxID=55508 RepID=A0A3G2EDE8_9BURK|nr:MULTISPECIES: S46 family peptidase [Janthinobacterium]AYM77469.1 S46 family peptidase [Janthinobacterium agaricidamnosum]OEZ59298.1 peptidase S46 [Janthinobacterium sp. HH100]OEZ68827.1 peptidase S46 [Janthinobacterium sp. HH103]QOU74682.1 Asp/Glu-specific dipeptidyl-peptidase [Janthinobacterium sp. HH102]